MSSISSGERLLLLKKGMAEGRGGVTGRGQAGELRGWLRTRIRDCTEAVREVVL